MSKTKLGKLKNGQFVITVPRTLVEAFSMRKGDFFEWMVDSGRIYINLIRGEPE